MSIVRPVPTGARNGLEGARHDYTYRGKLTLEAELPFECPAGCGRRMESLRFGPCAVCRGTWREPVPVPGPERAKRLLCKSCGYHTRSLGHRVSCGA